MKHTNLYTLLILAILACSIMACTAKHQPDTKALGVLSDFTFVGSTPYAASEKGQAPIQDIAFRAGEPQPFPKSLEVGRAYFFRHRRPLDDEKLALSELPSRLHKAGLQVLQAPTSGRDLISSYVGGPFFSIKFTDGHYTGRIANRLSSDYQNQTDSGWMGEDYIMVYTQ